MPILAAVDLGCRLPSGWIWRGITLSLSAGDRAVLTGPSGTGKSLLLRTLCGLDRLGEGHVLFRGESPRGHDVPDFRARVMYVQQQPLLIPGTVQDNLDLPTRFKVHARRESGEGENGGRAGDLLAQIGKPADFLEQRASVLSGGEGQVVGIVRALLLHPDVLLLDEPTAHLDPETTRRVEEVVLEWVGAGDRALLWTSHDPAQVDRVRRGSRIQLGGVA
ncbi:MAG: ATP-binding cassette domain-containing protein [Gemmatimonadota bacterium]|nr:ATP-binding cassette domain-containing protein [Gemmatimonadota bacterium]